MITNHLIWDRVHRVYRVFVIDFCLKNNHLFIQISISLFDFMYIFLGVYVPACDAEGYYEHTQCHSSVGMCWCVDKHGVEVPNSRVRGKPNCCKYIMC